MEAKPLNIMACIFKRTQASVEEHGIIIDDGDGPIIDMQGRVVTQIWTYRPAPHLLCVNFAIMD